MLALVIVALPFSRAGSSNFYYGAGSLSESLASLVGAPDWPRLSAFMMVTVPLLVAAGAWRERGVWTVTLGLSLAALALMHSVLGMPWPRGRTGLYLLPLAVLLMARLVQGLRYAAVLPGALAAACAVAITPGFYAEWRFDADNREVAQLLERDYPGARVAAAHPLSFGLGYYTPVVRLREGEPADVYVLRAGGTEARPAHLRSVRLFPRSGVEIAVAER